jgi:hypothetical protein
MMGKGLPHATRTFVAVILFVSFGFVFSGCAWLVAGIAGTDVGFLSGQMTKSPEASAAAGGVAGAGAGALVGAAMGGPARRGRRRRLVRRWCRLRHEPRAFAIARLTPSLAPALRNSLSQDKLGRAGSACFLTPRTNSLRQARALLALNRF